VYPIEVTRKVDHERRDVSVRLPLEGFGQELDGRVVRAAAFDRSCIAVDDPVLRDCLLLRRELFVVVNGVRVGRPFDWSEIVRQVQDGDGPAVVRAWVAAEAERAIGPTKAPMTAGRQHFSSWRPASR
jgi:hypothetical protein